MPRRSLEWTVTYRIGVHTIQWRIQGRGPAPQVPSLNVKANWGPKGRKKIFWEYPHTHTHTPLLHYLRQWMTPILPLSEGLDPPLLYRLAYCVGTKSYAVWCEHNLREGSSWNPKVIRNRSDFRQIFISVFILERLTWKFLARELTVKLDGKIEPANRSVYGGFVSEERECNCIPFRMWIASNTSYLQRIRKTQPSWKYVRTIPKDVFECTGTWF